MGASSVCTRRALPGPAMSMASLARRTESSVAKSLYCEAWVVGGALILVLDQVPRNIFRGSGHAFATDALALHYANRALAAGLDAQVEQALRMFLYLPFEHSETMADQQRAVQLFTTLGDSDLLGYATAHRDVIDRFGRFPHRNTALGRINTPEAQAWLAAGGGLDDPLLALVYGLYALWQIPHFWLRAGKRAGEYRRAGFPLPVFAGSAGTRGRLLEIWFCAFATALLMLPALPLFRSPVFRLAAAAAGLLALCGAGIVFRLRERYGMEKATGPAIAIVDGCLMLSMLLLVTDALLAPALAWRA